MAGAGYKLFNTGDVLTAAQVNTYLMEQTVMVFADAAARTTALSGVVSEGMISYLKDTNAVEVYDGSNWVSSDDPNAIQNTIVDAKGDLIAASAADTPARLAVGNNGETLVADSSASTGLRWQGNFAAGKNKIINGAFDIWQRGTSINPGNGSYGYTVDRWQVFSYGNGTTTVSRQTFTPGSAPVAGYEGQYFARVNSTNNQVVFEHIIEDVRTVTPGQTWTISFWARSQTAGDNLSLTFVQNFGSGGSSNVNTSILSSQALTTGWVRYSATFTAPSISGKTVGTSSRCDLSFLHPVNNYLEIWGVQLEQGNTATAFQTATGTLAGELAACQRYYWRLTPGGNYNRFGMAQALSATTANAIIQFPVAMRIAPTALEQSGTASNYAVSNAGYGAILALTSVPTFDRANSYNASVAITCSTGLVSGNASQFIDNNTSSAYLGWSAEL